MTYHLLGVPYSEANAAFSMCAFTAKVVRWCRMLNEMGVSYFVYANANTDSACQNVITIFSEEDRQAYYGDDAEWRERGGYFNQRVDSRGAIEWIRRTTTELGRRQQSNDIVIVTLGIMHKSIAESSGLPGVEVGVGYRETFSFYRIFESYTWLAAMTVSRTSAAIESVSHYDAVVPMCYFSDEFVKSTPVAACVDESCSAATAPYIAFVGRIVVSKGFRIAMEILCHSPELRLKVAGTGDLNWMTRDFPNCSDRVDYIGVITPSQRNEVLRHAVALVAPTMYVEPFGSIVVESMFLGTPVITTDHAAMSETVWHGVSGFRCRTLACFLRAVKQAPTLERARIVRYATENYLCSSLLGRYTEYFQDVLNLKNRGWYTGATADDRNLSQVRFYSQ